MISYCIKLYPSAVENVITYTSAEVLLIKPQKNLYKICMKYKYFLKKQFNMFFSLSNHILYEQFKYNHYIVMIISKLKTIQP